MANYVEIAKALAAAGYLSKPEYAIPALDVLADTLMVKNDIQKRAAAINDIVQQEKIIAGSSESTRQVAAVGNTKDLKVDQAILQDAVNQEQVDEVIIRKANEEIAEACQNCAAALVNAGWIKAVNLNDAAQLIINTWDI